MSDQIPDDVKKILGPNEQAQLYIRQKIYHPKINIDSIIITTQRIILRHPHAMGLKKDYTDFNYQDVANVVLAKGIMRSTVKLVLRFGGEPLTFENLPNKDAEAAYGLIRTSLARYQTPYVQPGMNMPFQQYPAAQPVYQAPAQSTVVERQVVKVKCRYCGALNDETAKVCGSCGATL